MRLRKRAATKAPQRCCRRLSQSRAFGVNVLRAVLGGHPGLASTAWLTSITLLHAERAMLLRRTLLLSGDFFLGGVIAVNLAKLILRLRTLGVGQVLALMLQRVWNLYASNSPCHVSKEV